MKRVVVVDTRLIAYQLYHRKQSQTEFLAYVYSLIGDLKYSKLVWTFDGIRGSVRRKTIYPEYKAHRKVNQKKQPESEQLRLKEFNKTYSAMAEYLKLFGTVIYNEGIEADDWANIIAQRYAGNPDYEICLVSSDGDWGMNLIADNIKQFHVSKLEWITKNNVYEVTDKYKEVNDIAEYQYICGLIKENVLGVNQLGIKRYYLAKESELGLFGQIKAWIKVGKYGMKLPEGYDTLEEMYEFNKELLRPVTMQDLGKEDRELFKEQFNSPRKVLSETDRMLMEDEIFGEVVYLSDELKDFYKIKE